MALKSIISAFFHATAPVSLKEKIISAAGAFIGVLATAFISAGLGDSATPLMIASLGASSVLLFAASHSPMAQPWSVVGGHLVSALVGVTCFRFIPDIYAAAAVAVALAIFVMHLLNCLHPPGGATALAMVIGDGELHRLGYGAVLNPVGLNVLVVLAAALIFNNLFLHRRYPSQLARDKKSPGGPPLAFGSNTLKKEDIENALKEMNVYIDVTGPDLERIYTHASLNSMRRRMGEIRCRDIMTRDVVTAEYGDELAAVWETMRKRKLKGVPVVDRARRVIGIITIVDFLKRVDKTHHEHPRLIDRMRAFIRRTHGLTSDKPEVVGQIMSSPVLTAREDTHIVSLIPLFSEHHIHHVPIVDKHDRVTGMVTQTDLSVALYRYWAAMP